MPSTAVIGLQYGDEGKGRVVDNLAGEHDYAVRFQGGPNAGHTVQLGNKKFILHNYPSGALYNKRCLIALGCQVDLKTLCAEIDVLEKAGYNINLGIDYRAHIILPFHKDLDGIEERARGFKIGTTGMGIGPSYADRKNRIGMRFESLEKLVDSGSEGSMLRYLEDLYNSKLKIANTYGENLSVSFNKMIEDLRLYSGD